MNILHWNIPQWWRLEGPWLTPRNSNVTDNPYFFRPYAHNAVPVKFAFRIWQEKIITWGVSSNMSISYVRVWWQWWGDHEREWWDEELTGGLVRYIVPHIFGSYKETPNGTWFLREWESVRVKLAVSSISHITKSFHHWHFWLGDNSSMPDKGPTTQSSKEV